MARTAFFRLGAEPNAARTLLPLTSCDMTTTALSRATDLPLERARGWSTGRSHAPSDPGYDEARAIHNGAVDRRPAALVRCADVADVIACVNFAREHDMALAIRGGAHSGGGFGVWDDALVIDLGGLRSTTVNPAAHTVRVDGGCTWGDVDHATGAFGMATPSGFIVDNWRRRTDPWWWDRLPVTRSFGLSIDNLLSADVVLADGSFVTASQTHIKISSGRSGAVVATSVLSRRSRCVPRDRGQRNGHCWPGALRHRRHRGRVPLVSRTAARSPRRAQRLARQPWSSPQGLRSPRSCGDARPAASSGATQVPLDKGDDVLACGA